MLSFMEASISVLSFTNCSKVLLIPFETFPKVCSGVLFWLTSLFWTLLVDDLIGEIWEA